MLWISCCKARDSCHFTHDRCALPDLESSNKILLHSSSSSASTICDERLTVVLSTGNISSYTHSLLVTLLLSYFLSGRSFETIKVKLIEPLQMFHFLAQPIVQIFNFLRTKIDLNDNFYIFILL